MVGGDLTVADRFLDSLFTERHMRTPDHNGPGYEETVIANLTALRGVRRILLAHGTADDNVHVQNTLMLVDRLVEGAAVNYDLMLFPDANHAIRFHGARKILYQRKQWTLPREYLRKPHTKTNDI